jgi:hypothetical protein
VLAYLAINAAGFHEFSALKEANCAGASAALCGQRFLFTFHTAILTKCVCLGGWRVRDDHPSVLAQSVPSISL